MPKQTKITDTFFKPKASSSSNDNVSNTFGLLLPIDDVVDENNLLDTFINSAINGGVKRNWNIQQLKKTVGDINSEFKPQIEKRTAFWEKELEKLNNIKIPIRKSSQSDIESGDKSQKTLLDYFTKNEKSSQNESNITTIVLESQDVPQDLVIPMLDPRTSDLNITTTNNVDTNNNNNNNNTIINNNTSNNTTIIDNNTTDDNNDIFLDEEEIIKPITPSETATNNNNIMDSEIITLTSNDLDDLLMEDIIQVPSNTLNTTEITQNETVKLSSPSLSSINNNNTTTNTITNTPPINPTTTSATSATTTATIPSSSSNNSTTASTTEIKLIKSPNLEGKKPKQEITKIESEITTGVEEILTTPKKTRKTTSSKKSTASKKTSKKGSKKRKVQDDDAMLDDDDDEYKPSLTDEEDLILDEEIEDDEDETIGKSGKRKRPAAKKVTDEQDEEILNQILDEEDEPLTIKTTTTNTTTNNNTSIMNSSAIASETKTITKQPSTKTSISDTTSNKSTSKTSSTASNSKSTIKEEDEEVAATAAVEDEEEIIETPIKTRSARKKTRQSGKSSLDSENETSANKSSTKSTTGSTTPTSVGNNDLFEEMSNSIVQSPSMEDEPQTPANSKKKKRTTTTVRRRKKKSEDGTVSSFSDGIDGGDSFLSHEDELYVSTNSNTDTSAPSYQFWDYVNSFFPVIKKDRLQLLEIEHSDDDDAFNISKRGKHYTEKWEDENCKLFPHLFKKEVPSPMENESISISATHNTTHNTFNNLSTTNNISFSNSINVDKNSKHFFSQHNLTQRLLSSLIEERDLVSVETFFNDENSSSSSSATTSGLVFDSDEESDSSSARKTTRSTRKSIAGNSNNIAQYSNVFASPSSLNNGNSNNQSTNAANSNINSMLDNFSNSFSILEQQQQHEIGEHLKQKLPTLSKTHNQKSNQVLQASNQFKDFEQQLFEPSFDYSSQYLNIFEEKLMSEIKSIGLLPPPPSQQTTSNNNNNMLTPLWFDEESREDDEICAEIRTLQNKLRQQMEKTNTYRMKILTSVKEKLHEETEIGKKILLFSELEKKLFPPTQKKR
ncbi:hypothetical protein NAEGRDRAFT_78556 [Naegleria gruberi]|uniref:Uncharacterized protein n=1 Tax=Naegleria gruberi TaxID=5762 RepID=D2V5C2_NAEGR|nr:uncharacterized protein NAEGRDRAFT_78556 [Naegleria gruberi]EFC47927.1 hypothetical protein NAEGRDRAFT_78556 [Naegleria gruberi]|eukprot:XP_002680671.1 hypothetical protein NAEGRDRAFT_78556 [Naegleria gruberi strain NEG-M]